MGCVCTCTKHCHGDVYDPAARADAQALLTWAEKQNEKGELHGALRTIKKGLKLCPRDPKLLAAKWRVKAALLEEEKGDIKAALGYHKRALKLEPRNTESLRAVAVLRLKLNQPHAAMGPLQHYAEELTSSSSSPKTTEAPAATTFMVTGQPVSRADEGVGVLEEVSLLDDGDEDNPAAHRKRKPRQTVGANVLTKLKSANPHLIHHHRRMMSADENRS